MFSTLAKRDFYCAIQRFTALKANRRRYDFKPVTTVSFIRTIKFLFFPICSYNRSEPALPTAAHQPIVVALNRNSLPMLSSSKRSPSKRTLMMMRTPLIPSTYGEATEVQVKLEDIEEVLADIANTDWKKCPID